MYRKFSTLYGLRLSAVISLPQNKSLLASCQFLFDEPADAKDQNTDAGVAKFNAERIIFDADDQPVHHFEQADHLQNFANQPKYAIQTINLCLNSLLLVSGFTEHPDCFIP